MKLKLVIAETNWADEMDVYSFVILTEKALKRYQKMVEKVFKEKGSIEEYYIGSNQFVSYDNLKDHNKNYKIQELTKKEADFLMKKFKIKINDVGTGITDFSCFGNWTLLSLTYLIDELDEDF